jgi:hypothetical protein
VTIDSLQQYVTLAIGIVTLIGLLGATTPKGMTRVLIIWNWLQRHVLFTHVYAEIKRVDSRIDALQSHDELGEK